MNELIHTLPVRTAVLVGVKAAAAIGAVYKGGGGGCACLAKYT